MKFQIGIKRLEEAGRSLAVLAQSSLCPKCRNNTFADHEQLLSNIRECCSKSPGFLDARLPLKSLIFRLFLSKGNRPFTVDELVEEIKRIRGIAPSSEALERVLKADRFYGFEAVDSSG